jgi:PilZ domain
MNERRAVFRRRTYKSGTITFGGCLNIECLVRNISDDGACLEVNSPASIPDDFNLVIRPDNIFRTCQVAWRAPDKIGVHFVRS